MFEIGSEFWLSQEAVAGCAQPPWDSWPGTKQFLVSGRTALSVILDDIDRLEASSNGPRLAYLPSYCCHTMIEPFLRHGMRVEFYPVIFEDGELVQQIDPHFKCDVILVLDYFGFSCYRPKLPEGAVIVRDMTHSLFAKNMILLNSDYIYASFRKWGAIAGAAIACKKKGTWISKQPNRQHQAYIALRNQGYHEKAEYIRRRNNDKAYLKTFQNAEEMLETDYKCYAADPASFQHATQIRSCIAQRRRNAQIILDRLRDCEVAQPIFSSIGKDDVPLFVPIIVHNGKRDMLRQYLIDKKVYCPVHWPLSEMHSITNEEDIYSSEISLICDQRYSEADMDYQLNIIKRYELEYA